MANEYGYELFSSSICCIYHDIQRIERAQMAKYGLKGPHAQCLLAMSRNPAGITAAELCELCEKDKAAISRTVAELEQAGVNVTVRRKLGSDVDASCGQLRKKVADHRA